VKLKKDKIYNNACKIVKTLQDNGYKAYFAGGAVRDMLLNIGSDDIDIATSAKPDEILGLFPKCFEIGAAFGIINVVQEDINFEVATFREERGYMDGRHPDEINYTEDPFLDAKRRDFTINSMFYDPVADRILDFQGGEADLRNGILRTVGKADDRFSEDYLRILRAVRFCTRFGFKLDEKIPVAVRKNLEGLSKISNERIREELNKMLIGPAPSESLKMLLELGILELILPEVAALEGVEQDEEFHPEGDVFVHTCLMLEHMSNPSVELAWSILLHDVGKPETLSIGDDERMHFYKHDKLGAKYAEEILKRFTFSNKEIENIVRSVDTHMRYAHVKEMRESKLKRLIAEPSFRTQLELHRIDCISSHAKMGNYIFLIDRLGEEEHVVELPKPFINGHDLIKMGMKPGKKMGKILNKISDMQLEGEIKSREEALEYVKELRKRGK
jgi:poly(A) polymerase